MALFNTERKAQGALLKTHDLNKLKVKVDEQLPPQAWTRIVLRVADLLSKRNLDLEILLNPPTDYKVDKQVYLLFLKVIKITYPSKRS